MNIQARSLQARQVGRPVRQYKARCESDVRMKWIVALNLLVIFGVIFGNVNYRISLNKKLAAMQREVSVVDEKIRSLNREAKALRIKKEQLSSWEYIRERIAYHNLPLVQPEYNQVQPLVMVTPLQSDEPQIAAIVEDRKARSQKTTRQ